MNKILVFIVLIISFDKFLYAERDLEYWPRATLNIPIKDKINYILRTEWRMKDNISFQYHYRTENAINFRINEYFEIAPYYVLLETRTKQQKNKSKLFYLDLTGSFYIEKHAGLKITNRLRWQHNYEKGITILRNSIKLTKTLNTRLKPLLFIEDEIFYDTESNKINENLAGPGLSFSLYKHIDAGISYLLISRKNVKWIYSNALVSFINIKF